MRSVMNDYAGGNHARGYLERRRVAVRGHVTLRDAYLRSGWERGVAAVRVGARAVTNDLGQLLNLVLGHLARGLEHRVPRLAHVAVSTPVRESNVPITAPAASATAPSTIGLSCIVRPTRYCVSRLRSRTRRLASDRDD